MKIEFYENTDGVEMVMIISDNQVESMTKSTYDEKQALAINVPDEL